jgi:hypothetical protein
MEVRDMQIMISMPMKKMNRPFMVPVMPRRLMNARKVWGNKIMIPMAIPLKIHSRVYLSSMALCFRKRRMRMK